MFPPEVKEKLKYYVYRLIDPRNGETFYVGKGKDNRVFSHAQGNIEKDSVSEKESRIRAIMNAGFEVSHIIHRHGMSTEIALEVEAALIDAYPGLTNIASGHGTSSFGIMHAEQVIRRYEADVMEFHHKAVLININRSQLENSVYEATRYSWRLKAEKANLADIVIAIVQGIAVEVFVDIEWLPANEENFPGREPIDGRFGFNGVRAPEAVRKLYVQKRLPSDFRKKGAANPIKYAL